jgi:hypothetical protein
MRTERTRFKSTAIDEWQWVLLPPRSKRTADQAKAAVQTCPPVVVVPQITSATLNAKLRYGVLRLLGESKEAAEQDAEVGRSVSNEIDKALILAPGFESLHKRTPNRTDKEGRPIQSSRKKYISVDFDAILFAVETSTQDQRNALFCLLSNGCIDISKNDLMMAFCALPSKFKMELCWPKGCIEPSLVAWLCLQDQVTGLCERKHVYRGIRVRVYRDAPSITQPQITHTTTLVRTALTTRRYITLS